MIPTTTRSFKTTRTLILSGLVVAGMLGNTAVKTFAASGTFALTCSLNTARWGHTATLLKRRSAGSRRVGRCWDK